MILIGQFDSPFVRRVGIAMRIYGLAFDHRPWSTFGDAALIAAHNPLSRVPTLVLDSGEALIESTAILDHLDEQAGDAALIARSGPARRHGLRICALATGLADKAVGLIYERALHAEVSAAWITRCETQIRAVLSVLETERDALAGNFWFGSGPGHADIAVGCAVRFLAEAHPGLFDAGRCPALAAHSGRCEALPAFSEITQVFVPPPHTAVDK